MVYPLQSDAIRAAVAMGACKPPMCGGSLRPWAPLIVPPQLDRQTVAILTTALQAIDADFLKENPDTPQLFATNCFYMPEPPGQEVWLSIPWCIQRAQQGHGIDCEDIACWRAAELEMRHGEKAKAFPDYRKTKNPETGEEGEQYHILVQTSRLDRTGNRLIEDPSRILLIPPEKRKVFLDPTWRGKPNAVGAWFNRYQR